VSVKHLFSDWEKVERVLKSKPHILLLSDYDGTLTPIVSEPSKAVMTDSFRGVLRRLSRKENFTVGVVSGRQLKDVRKLVGIRTIYYAGNHGFEVKGPGISFDHPANRIYKRYMDSIKKRMLREAAGIKGVIVEHKGASLSIHYRLVKEKDLGRLRDIFGKACAPYLDGGKIKVTRGKKVWEVRSPIKWDKGSAVGKIMKILRKGPRSLPMYLGDDKTDEDAFRFLEGRDSLTVFVGPNPQNSSARYYLKSPREVKEFLARLCRI
jgi:trehalose-phosphatase